MYSSYSSVASVLSPWAVKYAIAEAPASGTSPLGMQSTASLNTYFATGIPPAASSEALALSDFLVNSIIARPKTQGVTLKKAIDDPAASASGTDNPKKNSSHNQRNRGPVTSICSWTFPAAKPSEGTNALILLSGSVGPPDPRLIDRSIVPPWSTVPGSPRRMHVANGPRLPARALCKAGRMDPVLSSSGVYGFDDGNDSSGEIDGVGQSISLSVPATLLEIFDPDQNMALNVRSFRPLASSPLSPDTDGPWDRYPNVPIYLLQILFICLAKSLVTIASLFLDRCEFTHDERLRTARFLLPE
ncbi:hypothetical protein EDB85DRAFT_2151575 [Lactarius pseudohatsudake]|nr:hypothetical protein EDB85DRAFT_2151575 [Lactarius pseudohatsudake]